MMGPISIHRPGVVEQDGGVPPGGGLGSPQSVASGRLMSAGTGTVESFVRPSWAFLRAGRLGLALDDLGLLLPPPLPKPLKENE